MMVLVHPSAVMLSDDSGRIEIVHRPKRPKVTTPGRPDEQAGEWETVETVTSRPLNGPEIRITVERRRPDSSEAR